MISPSSPSVISPSSPSGTRLTVSDGVDTAELLGKHDDGGGANGAQVSLDRKELDQAVAGTLLREDLLHLDAL